MIQRFRMFKWRHGHKCQMSDHELATLVQDKLGDILGTYTPGQVQRLSAVIGLIANINHRNTLKAIEEYHEWMSGQVDKSNP